MKKKLLKPPQNDGEMLFLPDVKDFFTPINEDSKIGTAHQPYFFNPGVTLKFLLLENLPLGKQEIIFVDTDKVRIDVKIPSAEGLVKTVVFINTDRVLSDYPAPEKDILDKFLNAVEHELSNTFPQDPQHILSTFLIFKDIILNNSNKKLLKEVLVGSFLKFYDIKRDYSFLSHLIRGEEFADFFLKIYKDNNSFRDIFNQALDEYRKEFRFRYKNFPFPKLLEDELPFWVVKDGKRKRCFKKDLSASDIKKLIISPRASTLTIFLRLYKLDFFIHGIGGANYEWVLDRVIERFFKQTPPIYAIISGTFLIANFTERDFPYFLFSPTTIKARVKSFLWGNLDNK